MLETGMICHPKWKGSFY